MSICRFVRMNFGPPIRYRKLSTSTFNARKSRFLLTEDNMPNYIPEESEIAKFANLNAENLESLNKKIANQQRSAKGGVENLLIKNPNFCQRSTFLSKIEIFVKNPIFCQRSKF